ncbi:MAG: CesT family type III secretion system chaperone [Myxococcales bacterium]|nr:CesT family type III secretion system chaperone [Myxococcales bacterium]
MLDESALRKHLATLGWGAVDHGAATFRCSHATEEGEVVVYLRLQEHWLVGSVVPFLSTKGDNSFELARWLLRMNRDMHQVKFAYDEDGDVILTVELPTESLDYSEIRAALEGLVAQAVKHRRTLRAAAAS